MFQSYYPVSGLFRLMREDDSLQVDFMPAIGLVKKVGHTYKYYVTAFGKDVIATALKLRELVVIPQLAFAPAA